MGAVFVQSITALILGKTGPDFKQSTNGRAANAKQNRDQKVGLFARANLACT